MKEADIFEETIGLHNKLLQMLKERIFGIIETALVYGEASQETDDWITLHKEVRLETGVLDVDFCYGGDGKVSMASYAKDIYFVSNGSNDMMAIKQENVYGSKVYIWAADIVNANLINEAIDIITLVETENENRPDRVQKDDAWKQNIEIGFMRLGGVRTHKMSAQDYAKFRRAS